MVTPGVSDAANTLPVGAPIRLGLHQLWLRDSGPSDQPVLVCLHGFPSSSADFARVWPLLTPHFRMIALDWLGLGQSDKPHPHVYRIAEQADLLEALLQRLAINSCALLAHDYGDTVAQELLARQQSGTCAVHVRAVVLLNGGLFPEAHRPRLVQRLLCLPVIGPVLAQAISRSSYARSMRAIFGPDTPPDAAFLDDTWAALKPREARRVLPALLGYLAERRAHRSRWLAGLTAARVPIRFVVGMADPISGAHMADRYEALISRANVVRLNRIGHYPQWEAPGAVVAAALPVLLSAR